MPILFNSSTPELVYISKAHSPWDKYKFVVEPPFSPNNEDGRPIYKKPTLFQRAIVYLRVNIIPNVFEIDHLPIILWDMSHSFWIRS
ncbi:unnamed protein product [Cunninghamella blakesleeana]